MTQADLVIVGAGAAGLAAAIFAGEAAAGRGWRIVLLDGAKKPGAKILVSGGGRCNVTHERVTPEDYCGGPRPLIRSVLRAFDERATVGWMRSLGVELKCEPTGKLFPVSDQARTVLDALLGRAAQVGAALWSEARVTGLRLVPEGFALSLAGQTEPLLARRVILATGGLALPKSGSDGAGLAMARRLGHTLVPTTPALSPLVLAPDAEPGGRFAELSGMTLDVCLTLRAAAGAPALVQCAGSMVFTHFGLSGPAALDLSRHYLRTRLERPEAPPQVTLGHPALATVEAADAWLRRQVAAAPRRAVLQAVQELYPERLARLLTEGLGDLAHLTREERLALARRLAALALPVTGDRGYAFAEATAGGVELREVDVRTMASRVVPGLFLCGEMLDVDGRLGGFNFQWAWASGALAGRAAAHWA